MGSLAFGALILTLIQIIRIILEYIDHKTRGEVGHSRVKLPSEFLFYCVTKIRKIQITVPWSYSDTFRLLFNRGTESSGTFHYVLPQVLLLVFGEVHQVPQQKRLHHGELSRMQRTCGPLPSVGLLHQCSNS